MLAVFSLGVLLGVLLAAWAARGSAEGQEPPPGACKYMNKLISVGFKVTDPEGFTVEHFDEE